MGHMWLKPDVGLESLTFSPQQVKLSSPTSGFNHMCPMPYKRSVSLSSSSGSPSARAVSSSPSPAPRLGTSSKPPSKKQCSSTVSLVASVEADPEVRVDLEGGEGGGLVIRRNSIHGAVPYVDVNDPGTRARMEVYKQERRNALRAKYKAVDYKTPQDVPQDHHIIPSETPTANA